MIKIIVYSGFLAVGLLSGITSACENVDKNTQPAIIEFSDGT
ncbi:hypothetical protein ACFLXH_01125 [Chloroflexota bacterium]